MVFLCLRHKIIFWVLSWLIKRQFDWNQFYTCINVWKITHKTHSVWGLKCSISNIFYDFTDHGKSFISLYKLEITEIQVLFNLFTKICLSTQSNALLRSQKVAWAWAFLSNNEWICLTMSSKAFSYSFGNHKNM